MPFSRFTIRIGLAILAVGVVWSAFSFIGLIPYHFELRATRDLVQQLRDRRPPHADKDEWEMGSDWVQTAYGNVCFAPSYVSHKELIRFRADLEQKLQGPIDLSIFDWVWERLGQTGPHGKRYCERYIVLYHDGLEAVRELRTK